MKRLLRFCMCLKRSSYGNVFICYTAQSISAHSTNWSQIRVVRSALAVNLMEIGCNFIASCDHYPHEISDVLEHRGESNPQILKLMFRNTDIATTRKFPKIQCCIYVYNRNCSRSMHALKMGDQPIITPSILFRRYQSCVRSHLPRECCPLRLVARHNVRMPVRLVS